MITRYFEPTIPITNEELYDMVEGLTIRTLKRHLLTYLGHPMNRDSIQLQRSHGPNPVIQIRRSEDLAPIAIVGYQSCDEDIRRLSKLLRMGLKGSVEGVVA